MMDNLPEKLLNEKESALGKIWKALPQPEKNELEKIVKNIPTQDQLFKLLIKQALTQFKYTFGSKQRIAILGPANVGKSTLYNQFIQSQEDKALVSPIPGTTQANQEANAGLFTVVDTPGADAVGEVGYQERDMALDAAREADVLVIVFDAIQGIKQTELELFQDLKNLNKPYIIALNKIDLVKKDRSAIIEKAAANLKIEKEEITPVSAKNGDNITDILRAIILSEPEVIVALGKALPAYRWQLAWRTIISAASTSAVIALTPLPVIDFAPLIIIQTTMVIGIAKIYDYPITFKRAKELLATFGLGFLGRMLFQELSKFGGVPGWILSAAIAASTTVVMGVAAAQWFEKGEKITSEQLKTLSKNITNSLIESIKNIRNPQKDKKRFKKIIEDTLQESSQEIIEGSFEDKD